MYITFENTLGNNFAYFSKIWSKWFKCCFFYTKTPFVTHFWPTNDFFVPLTPLEKKSICLIIWPLLLNQICHLEGLSLTVWAGWFNESSTDMFVEQPLAFPGSPAVICHDLIHTSSLTGSRTVGHFLQVCIEDIVKER